MVFQCINIRQVPREVLKTAASGLGFQHLPRDLANVNAWKTMFDPYIHLPIWLLFYTKESLSRMLLVVLQKFYRAFFRWTSILM